MSREDIQRDLDRIDQMIETLKELREKTVAELPKEPEWVPFPGEIVEVRDDDDRPWQTRVAVGGRKSHRYMAFADSRTTGSHVPWVYCRPLPNPNVIQLRPHTPGDPMPCDGKQKVLCRNEYNTWSIGPAENIGWFRVTGWAPLPEDNPRRQES